MTKPDRIERAVIRKCTKPSNWYSDQLVMPDLEVFKLLHRERARVRRIVKAQLGLGATRFNGEVHELISRQALLAALDRRTT